jgi:hypothetical protein
MSITIRVRANTLRLTAVLQVHSVFAELRDWKKTYRHERHRCINALHGPDLLNVHHVCIITLRPTMLYISLQSDLKPLKALRCYLKD